MSTIRQIAQDPHKALSDLEKDLGVEPGQLLEEMDDLAPPGDDWSQHLPFRVVVSYYEQRRANARYAEHVEGCGYCQKLLETLHPTPLQVKAFARKAKRPAPKWIHRWTPAVLAAGLAMCAVGGTAFYTSWSSPAMSSTSNVCVADGGDPTGCTLLSKAAKLQSTDLLLSHALLVAGLSESGAKEPTLKNVSAALDPTSTLPEKSATVLTAAQSSFKSGQPATGYEQLLAYIRESETSEAPAKAFEAAFMTPVRARAVERIDR